jgi:hypothetical protein
VKRWSAAGLVGSLRSENIMCALFPVLKNTP